MNAGRWGMLVGLVMVLLLNSVGPVAAAPSTSNDLWHQVKPGETLFSIARLYGVSPWAIASANGLVDPNRILVGQWLLIPAVPVITPTPVPTVTPAPTCNFYYTVRYGDTLSAIGRRYGISPWSIAAVNGIYNLNYIRVGQQLWIPCS